LNNLIEYINRTAKIENLANTIIESFGVQPSWEIPDLKDERRNIGKTTYIAIYTIINLLQSNSIEIRVNLDSEKDYLQFFQVLLNRFFDSYSNSSIKITYNPRDENYTVRLNYRTNPRKIIIFEI